MKINGSELLEQRALQLAIVHLSRRNELLITQARDEYGIDLLVNLTQGGKMRGRLFGVMVKASRSLSVKTVGEEKNQFKLPISSPPLPEDLPFPLALFVFNMEDDEGYCRWLLSPVLTDAQSPRLSFNHDSLYNKLSSTTIDQTVAQVNRWYELRSPQPMVKERELVRV